MVDYSKWDHIEVGICTIDVLGVFFSTSVPVIRFVVTYTHNTVLRQSTHEK